MYYYDKDNMNLIGTTYFRAPNLNYPDLYLEEKNDFLVLNMDFLMTCP